MPVKKHTFFHIILWTVGAIVFGASFSAGVASLAGAFYGDAIQPARFFVEELLFDKSGKTNAVVSTTTNALDGGATAAIVPLTGRAVRVDFEIGEVALFKDGALLSRMQTLSMPDPFSPWRVPQGVYPVLRTEASHFSPLAEASFENSVLFAENGLIRAVATTTALGGGIALSAPDAESLFSFALPGTPIVVLNEIPEQRALSYAAALIPEKALAPPRVSARVALVADVDTGEVLFQKASDEARPIASITKLFTALVAKEKLALKEKITVSREAFSAYGGNGGLSPGDTFYAEELLYPLIIESSNDAAEALAESAGRAEFISAMNGLVKKLGLEHTTLLDPSGLSPKNVSTADDLFRFAQILLSAEGGSQPKADGPQAHSSGGKEYTDILAITKILAYELPQGTLREWPRIWRTNNEFVRDGNPYLLGTKNGYTDEALQTTLSLFALPVSETQEKRVAVILLGSSNREGDAAALLRYAGATTLYKNPQFAESFRKRAADYAAKTEKENPEFRLALLGTLRAEDAVAIGNAFSYLKSYDAVLADVSGIVADTGYNIVGESARRTPTAFLEELRTLGVDVVNVANAHAGDWGRGAFGEYVRTLKEKNFLVAGGSGEVAERRQTPLITRGGVSVAFLSFSDEGPEWLSQDEYLPSILSAKDPHFREIIENAARAADHLVVSIAFSAGGGPLSGGDGISSEDSAARKKELTRDALAAGARIVADASLPEEGAIFYNLAGVAASPLPSLSGKHISEIVFDKNSVKEILF